MSKRILVGTRKGLFVLSRGRRGWAVDAVQFLGDPVTAAARVGEQLLVALNLGHFGTKLWRGDSDARGWVEQAAPAYPEKPEDSADAAPWSTQLVWTLESGGHGARVWAGTIPGGLFRSDDVGSSWSLVRSLWDDPSRAQWFGGGYDHPGIHSVCVDPRDPDHLTLGISCGGVWHSEDAGASWEPRTGGMTAAYQPPELAENPFTQDPHRLSQCRAAPEVIWCQHHDTAYRSTDRGLRWDALERMRPSRFGFAVAAHPGDPLTAWFVPAVKDECRVPVDARLVVSRTRDGGESYEVLSEGLPSAHAYDLVYRHALDVDASGERLVFGSTTGGLWISEDGGDRWRALDARLPPINCVRFDG